ncbi:hypothetical protein QYM36_013531 [Artemia franciscana]|uniref:Uncharacterized protein n=1 Tax=Artemia franciscana TaxID=6661 RepID=A0AA88HII9_ARTSF|nr:hypothetical protein QYM36_013531 [Artemia franciscana]
MSLPDQMGLSVVAQTCQLKATGYLCFKVTLIQDPGWKNGVAVRLNLSGQSDTIKADFDQLVAFVVMAVDGIIHGLNLSPAKRMIITS